MRKIKKAHQGLFLDGILKGKRKKPAKPNVFQQKDAGATSAEEDSALSTNDLPSDIIQLNKEREEEDKTKRYRNILGASLLGLGILTDILPDSYDQRKLVQPEIEFNPNQYGTGSQAIYKKGGELSASKAKEMLKDGKANGKKLTKKQKRYFGMVAAGKAEFGMDLGGGPGDPVKNRLNFDQINEWNKFIATKPQGDNLSGLFSQYTKLNPKTTIGYDALASELELLSTGIKAGSKQEGLIISDSAHTGFAFPTLKFGGQDYGPMNGDLLTKNPAPKLGGLPRSSVKSSVPDYVKQLEYNNSNGYPYYIDEQTGDITYVDQRFRNDPRYNKNITKTNTDTAKLASGGKMLGQLGGSDIFEFKGPSHEEGGIPIVYQGVAAEVEGGETAFVGKEGDLNILGNMNFPGTKTKFKTLGKKIKKQEDKNAKLLDKSLNLINEFGNPRNSFDKLKFNSGKVMLEGGLMEKKHIDDTKERLAAIQNVMLESEGGNMFDDGGKISAKFAKTKARAEELLQKLYPGKKVEIKEYGAKRDIKEQRGLVSAKASTTSVSLHNFGGARDYIIYVDGKQLGKKDLDVYKKTIQAAAKENGLYHIGDWDPGHIGVVQEGKGNTFGDLIKAYPELATTEAYANSVGFLKNLVESGKADKQEILAYNQLTGSNIDPKKAITPNYKESEKYIPKGKGEWFNQTFIPDDTPITLPPAEAPKDPAAPQQPGEPFEYVPNDYPLTQNIKNPPPFQSPLDIEQVAPEIYNMFTNRTEPVPAQFYSPQLFDQYQVTLQDQRNANQATFNATERVVGNNPEALSVLNAQKYAADNHVTGEEFRINQAIFNDVSSKNIGLQNDAQLKNLGIADTQMVRQSTARSKTRAQTQLGLNSVASKTLQNRYENLDSAFKQMLFKHRPVDKDNDGLYETLEYQGAAPVFTPGAMGNPSPATPFSRTRTTYDSEGNVKQKTIMDPAEVDKPVMQQRARKAMFDTSFLDNFFTPQKMYRINKRSR